MKSLAVACEKALDWVLGELVKCSLGRVGRAESGLHDGVPLASLTEFFPPSLHLEPVRKLLLLRRFTAILKPYYPILDHNRLDFTTLF